MEQSSKSRPFPRSLHHALAVAHRVVSSQLRSPDLGSSGLIQLQSAPWSPSPNNFQGSVSASTSKLRVPVPCIQPRTPPHKQSSKLHIQLNFASFRASSGIAGLTINHYSYTLSATSRREARSACAPCCITPTRSKTQPQKLESRIDEARSTIKQSV